MRKFGIAVVAVTVASIAASAVAQESTYILDLRDNSAGPQSITTPAAPFNIDGGGCGFYSPQNGGGRGDGQIVRIMPQLPTSGLHLLGPAWPDFDGDGDQSTASLHLYAQVNNDADAPAGTNDVISSIGVDIAITDMGTSTDHVLGSSTWAWTGQAGVTWSGTSAGSPVAGGVGGHNDVRAVKVPVTSGPLYNTAGALVPTNLYRVGQLNLQAGVRTAPCAGAGTYGVKLSVDSLLITRVFSTGGSASPEEDIAFGYAGGAPEDLDAGAEGNTEGGTSASDDATVLVQMKGDVDLNGTLNTDDLGALLAFTDDPNLCGGGGLPQEILYAFDFDGNLFLNTDDLGALLFFTDDIGCPG